MKHFVTNPIPNLLKLILKNILWGFKLVVIAILLAVALRVFVFASFLIPTPSMEPSVLPGDHVLVNKLAYGARVIKNFKFMDGGKFETFRVKGFSKVGRNDVIVFNYPYSGGDRLQPDLNLFFIKRCVAIPGDTFYIVNGIYKVKNCADTLGCYPRQLQLSQMNEQDFDPNTFHCFPQDDGEHHWNIQSFGPLYIPRKGDTISIGLHNIQLYRKLIQYESDREVYVKQDTVYVGNEILSRYVFRQNYYFMAGDLVFDSHDSRYWGLLPEDHIVGKAAIIWQSKDIQTGKRRWERLLRVIN